MLEITLARLFFSPPSRTKEGKRIEKTFLFFEHKGTRIFQTRKPRIKKKHHIRCFLNYHAFSTNKTLVFLHKLSFL